MPVVEAPFEKKYSRIVSVVPSQTELLASLGLDIEVLGITKFCIHPEGWRNSRAVIGVTKKLNIEKIRQLNPDIIIANKEENQKEDIELLNREFDIYMSDIKDLNSALMMITDVGRLTNKEEHAEDLIKKIRIRFEQLVPVKEKLSAAYLIWKKPYMVAGTDTFINSMLEACGFENTFHQSRYPETTIEELAKIAPDLILLSSEPYPFGEKHITELSSVLKKAKILLVDGECFSWYGSRLMISPLYFQNMINDIQAHTIVDI
ncbi:MAG: helical backbone metal receptor [Ginsengibacter sp.]